MPSATRVDVAFWDTSGLVLLCTRQPATHQARRLARAYRPMAYWWATPVEARSAFSRLMREGLLSPGDVTASTRRLSALRRAAVEVLPSEEVRELAESMVERFDLRAADAFQLAAALVLCRRRPRDRPFVCFDRRLSMAASVAGFAALP